MDKKRPPRIAILLPRRERYAESGAGAVSTVADSLARFSRFRVLLKVLGAPVGQPLDGASFFPIRLAPFWHGSATRRYLVEAVRILKKDAIVVEIHNRPKYVPFLRKKLPHTALVLYLHNDPRTMEGTKSAEERERIAGQVQAVVCVSDYVRRCFLEGLGNDAAAKTHALRNAVDTEALCPPPEGEKRKEIIFIGRTIADKGPHLLVEAAEKLLPAYPDWKIVLIGGRYFGQGKAEAYEKDLFRRVANLGRQGEVTGYLPHEDVLSRLRQASIAVLPSLWDEPIQLAAMEAAACGCAVITTRRGGIPEGMGEAALYLPEETPGAVAAMLRPLLDDPALCRAWQQKAREHVVRNGDVRQAASGLDALRQKLGGFPDEARD
ncbi:MAG: glycosyltransferase family 4 protein [Alphaproteobacteria bacterium]|nr:glycosyltransferase family 4 protein [Alphaproteobacteria bacterium]